jgi:hydrogenase-4 component B
MPHAASLLTGTSLFWLLTCLLITIFGKNGKHNWPSGLLFLGSLVVLLAAALGWSGDVTWDAPQPIYLAVAPLSLRLDSLASIFIGLLAIISISISFFSPGYLVHLDKQINTRVYWVELFLFVIGMLGLILAANALTFLVFWEWVALTSVLLVAANLSSHESRTAAFIYLGATRIATGLLMAGFLWMHTIFNSWDFTDWHLGGHQTLIPALMILIGLCIKAGIWPFHDWLHHAHPAAPSPVSALMSGIMIKISLYAIIRIFVMNGAGSPGLSYLMLFLGIISAFWGILHALLQDDLKCLLAYSSIENVGLILLGIGLSLICNRLHMPVLAGLSLAAAIFHSVNHGLFKSLLFLGAGAVDTGAHSRKLEVLGGLGKKMPMTMIFFVIGCAAICSLPPLNGFSSKWLLYSSLFQTACGTNFWLGVLSVACIGILAIVSGLALACFAKVIGIAFLGRARSPSAENAQEATFPMQAAQAILAILCVVLGVYAPNALAIIQPICWQAFPNTGDLSSAYTMPIGALAAVLVGLTVLIHTFWLTGARGGVRRFITWECGFGDLSARMQGTALSFAENVAYTFAPLVQYTRYSIIVGRDRRHFPEKISTEVHMGPILESRIYGPAIKSTRWLGEHVLLLQAGSVHLYLSYILLTLVALMLVGILI